MCEWIKITGDEPIPPKGEVVVCVGMCGGLFLGRYENGRYYAISTTSRKAVAYMRIPQYEGGGTYVRR